MYNTWTDTDEDTMGNVEQIREMLRPKPWYTRVNWYWIGAMALGASMWYGAYRFISHLTK